MSENNLYRQNPENKTGNHRKKEGKIMNRKSVVAIVAAALLGVGAVSYIALRPQTGSEAALPVAVQPAEEDASNRDAAPDTGDAAAPAADTDTPDTDTTDTTDTSDAAPEDKISGGKLTGDKAPSETPAPAATQAEPAAQAGTETPAADTTTGSQGSGAVQVGDEQQANPQPSPQPGGSDSQQQEDGGQHTPSQPSAQGTVQAADILALTNQERQANGLPALSAAQEQAAADTRARELAQVFAHTRPDGSSCFTAVSGSYTYEGENIAFIQGEASAQRFLELWMGSEGHRANILGQNYVSMAVGVFYDSATNTTYAVQMFFGEPLTPAEPTYTYVDTVVAPTCTEQGYTLHTCNEDESKSYKDSYTDALGHDWDEGTETQAATCTADGVKTFTCSRCNETRTEAIPATGHQTEVRNAKEATCTTDGYTGDTVCTVCGEVIEAGETIPATGHHFVDGKCTVCGEADPDYRPEIEYTYIDTVIAPTCTEQGYTLHTCNEDESKSYKDNYTAALGHDWDEGTETQAATCTADGVKTFTCSRCNETRTEAIPATGHQTEVRNAKEATCTTDGYTGDMVCTVCGEVIEAGEAIPATGHQTEVRNAKEATCTTDGYTGDTVCTVCGEVIEAGETIPAAGHTFVDGKCTVCGEADPDYRPEIEYTYTDTVVAPTCTEQGYTLHICNEDESKSYKDSYTDALGHDWDGKNLGAKCKRCGTDLFVFDHTVEATCQDGGYDVYVSVEDPSQIRMTNFTDPVDHTFVDGKCTVCGAKDDTFIPSYDDNYNESYYNSTIASLTNEERESRGLEPLRYASEYQAAADIRAQEIVTNFSHTRPDGSGAQTALDALGAKYDHVGENIAYVSSMYKPGKIVENWMASSGHAANILEQFLRFLRRRYCLLQWPRLRRADFLRGCLRGG